MYTSIATSNTRITLIARLILWFVAINAYLGAGSLILFPTQTDNLFFWEIKPAINAALFGALYLGGAITVSWVAYRGIWEEARFLVPVLVTAGFFISLTTALHLERFDTGIKLAYWLVIYVGAPLLALGIYITQERKGANWAVQTLLLPAVRLIALITGAVVLTAGMGLLIVPTAVIELWPWTTTPLMVRIFASWFNAFGVGLLWFTIDRDWMRLRLIAYLMMTASALDLFMIFLYQSDWKAANLNVWVYCFHLVIFGLAGLLLVMLQRKAVHAA